MCKKNATGLFGSFLVIPVAAAAIALLSPSPVMALSIDKFDTYTAEKKFEIIEKFINKVSDDLKPDHADFAKAIHDHFLEGKRIGIDHVFAAKAAVEIEQAKGTASTATAQIENLMGYVIKRDLHIALTYDKTAKKYSGAAEVAAKPAP